MPTSVKEQCTLTSGVKLLFIDLDDFRDSHCCRQLYALSWDPGGWSRSPRRLSPQKDSVWVEEKTIHYLKVSLTTANNIGFVAGSNLLQNVLGWLLCLDTAGETGLCDGEAEWKECSASHNAWKKKKDCCWPFWTTWRELLKQMDEKFFMKYRSEPHGEIHHTALIQHKEVSTVREAASIPRLRVSFAWSTQKSLQRENYNETTRSLLSEAQTKCSGGWRVLQRSFHSHGALGLTPFSILGAFALRACDRHQSWTDEGGGTYTGSWPPTSCRRFPGNTWACVRTPADHLADRRHKRSGKVKDRECSVILRVEDADGTHVIEIDVCEPAVIQFTTRCHSSVKQAHRNKPAACRSTVVSKVTECGTCEVKKQSKVTLLYMPMPTPI